MIVGRILKKLDVFSTTEFLKINGQNAHKTKTGGFLTLIFVALVLFILIIRLKSRSNGELMTFKAKTQFNLDHIALNTSSFSKEKFMLAVGIKDEIFQYNVEHFHMELRVITIYNNDKVKPTIEEKNYRLEPCYPFHWDITPQMKQLFLNNRVVNGGRYMCLPTNITINLQGQQKSNQISYAEILIAKCNQRSFTLFKEICQPIGGFIDSHIDLILNQGKFDVDIIYSNSIINPDELNYKSYYMETLRPIGMTNYQTSQLTLEFSKYDVKINRNYINQQEPQRETGAFVKNPENIRFTTQSAENKAFVSILLMRSKDSLIVEKNDHTLVDILSYIGGLAATFFAIFQVICSQYSSFSFEIQASHNMYEKKDQPEDPRQNINEGSPNQPPPTIKKKETFYVNIFSFLKTNFWCFCKNQKIVDYRKQLSKQMDVQLIIQKIGFFERAISILIKNRSIKLEEIDKNADKMLQAKQFRKLLYKFYPKHEESVNLTIIQQNKSSAQAESNQPAGSSSNLHQGPLEIVLNNLEPDPNFQNLGQQQIENNNIEQGISQGFTGYLQDNNFPKKRLFRDRKKKEVREKQMNDYDISPSKHSVNENESRQDKQMIDDRLRNIKRLNREYDEYSSEKRGLEGKGHN